MEFLKLTLFLCFAGAFIIVPSQAKTWLRADGRSDSTYNLINSVLGGTAVEVPDCAHSGYGPHITQRTDTELDRPVFAFHAHVAQDNDRCINFDRQRIEIKTYDPSPSGLKGYQGETVTLSWNIRLNSQFQASSKFTHLHQLKAKGGDDSLPLITMTARQRGSSNILEVIYTGRDGNARVLQSEDLSVFAGKWVHAKEEVTYSSSGKYSLVLSRTDNGQHLMTVTATNIDLWRDGTEFIRPKWGIYRSLLESSSLRDEHVYFDNFCLAKGTSDKCT
ncbi:unnamed protein product [Orchesella dallaii]|uniref:Uncharacterized protein n=1 Tax=Orchesella dallaii TaxID=48710 RepID=A0ABP1R304_9HEXA